MPKGRWLHQSGSNLVPTTGEEDASGCAVHHSHPHPLSSRHHIIIIINIISSILWTSQQPRQCQLAACFQQVSILILVWFIQSSLLSNNAQKYSEYKKKFPLRCLHNPHVLYSLHYTEEYFSCQVHMFVNINVIGFILKTGYNPNVNTDNTICNTQYISSKPNLSRSRGLTLKTRHIWSNYLPRIVYLRSLTLTNWVL